LDEIKIEDKDPEEENVTVEFCNSWWNIVGYYYLVS